MESCHVFTIDDQLINCMNISIFSFSSNWYENIEASISFINVILLLFRIQVFDNVICTTSYKLHIFQCNYNYIYFT